MAIRTGQINGTGNLTRDHDLGAFGFSLYRDYPGAGGVLSGLAVTTNSVAAGRSLLGVTRTAVTPNEQFLVHIELTAAETIDTSGTKKIWLEAIAARVNDPSLNTVADGTGISQIATGADWPATPHVRLASTSGGVITDERVFLKTSSEIGRGGSDYAAATGSSGAYAIALTPATTAYFTGMRLSFKANHTNSGAATLNVNGLGAKALKISDGITDPAAGFILSGALLEVRYDGTNFAILSAAYTGNSVASQAEAEAGADNVKLMTPLRTKQQVDARVAAGPIGDTSSSFSDNTAYSAAASAGFVTAWSDGYSDLQGFTDANASPTTLVARSTTLNAISSPWRSFICFPVKKSNYWKVTGSANIRFTPIGF